MKTGLRQDKVNKSSTKTPGEESSSFGGRSALAPPASGVGFVDRSTQIPSSEPVSRVVGEVSQEVVGGVRLVGPAITLEPGITSSVTGSISIDWTLWEGSPQSGTIVDQGEFIGGAVVHGGLSRGVLYTLQMQGGIVVHESNLIFNDAQNGILIAAEWVIQPAAEEGRGSEEGSVELVGVPVIRPLRSLLTPKRTDWNILVRPISSPRRGTSQVGLDIRFAKSSSESATFGGSLEFGNSAEGSVSSSRAVSLSDEGRLSAAFRFVHTTVQLGEPVVR